jgi:hypothetical protein
LADRAEKSNQSNDYRQPSAASELSGSKEIDIEAGTPMGEGGITKTVRVETRFESSRHGGV